MEHIEDTAAPAATADRLDRVEQLLLTGIRQADAPVGARSAAQYLAEQNTQVSEATASRLLAQLDSLGLTRPLGRKGRVITHRGLELANTLQLHNQATLGVASALRIETIHQLIDLLYVRRGFEREVAYLAALRATDEDLLALRAKSVDLGSHLDRDGFEDTGTVGLSFHRVLLAASHSPLLIALGGVILHETLDTLDPVLNFILGRHRAVTSSHTEHGEILQALEARDPAGARDAVDAHVTRLIVECDRFSRDVDPDVFRALLRNTH